MISTINFIISKWFHISVDVLAELLEELWMTGMMEAEEQKMMMMMDHKEEDEDLEHWHLWSLHRNHLLEDPPDLKNEEI